MIWLNRLIDKRWLSSRDERRNDDGEVESILTAKVAVFVLEPTFPILRPYPRKPQIGIWTHFLTNWLLKIVQFFYCLWTIHCLTTTLISIN